MLAPLAATAGTWDRWHLLAWAFGPVSGVPPVNAALPLGTNNAIYSCIMLLIDT